MQQSLKAMNGKAINGRGAVSRLPITARPKQSEALSLNLDEKCAVNLFIRLTATAAPAVFLAAVPVPIPAFGFSHALGLFVERRARRVPAVGQSATLVIQAKACAP